MRPLFRKSFVLLLLPGLALFACHDDKASTAPTPKPDAFTVGGTVTGSSGNIVLSCNGSTVTVTGNGNFVCPGTLADGDGYAVSVTGAPDAESCTVSAGTGQVTDANVQLSVLCQQTAYPVTVSVSGLFSGGNFLLALGSVTQVVADNGTLPVTLTGTPGAEVRLSIAAQPPGQLCALNLASFSFSPTPAHVAVVCVRDMHIDSGAAAATVLGQTDFVTGAVHAAPIALGDFNAPVGRVAASNDGRVFVCEYAGNQVSAVMPGADTSDSFRLGVDVSQNSAARYGPEDLSGPTAVAVSDTGTTLAVASGGGSRVLLYDGVPAAATAANIVVGQAGFGAPPVITCSPNNFVAPTDVAIAGGRLFVSDSACNRVLIFDPVPTASGAGANMVLGQSSFTAYDPNRGFSNAGPGTLNHPGAVWAEADTLFVADSYNNRVLVWLAMPITPGQPADAVLGQPSFTSVAAAAGVNGMYVPYGLVADDHTLYVADASNNRVLIYPLPLPTSGTPQATGVLGHVGFDAVTHNAVSASSFYEPTGLGFFNATLLVNDGLNYRVLGFASR